MRHWKHVLAVLIAISSACSSVGPQPSDAKKAAGPLELAVELPEGWTTSAHPGLYKDGEKVVFVNERNLSQVSVWLVPSEGTSPEAIAKEMYPRFGDKDTVRAGDSRTGTWQGLRWAAFRGQETDETFRESSAGVVRELKGAPYTIVVMGVWPEWRGDMRKGFNRIVSRIHVVGTVPAFEIFDWIPDRNTVQ